MSVNAMPHVTFFIDGQEIDPCEHTQTILEIVQSCDAGLGRRLLGRPGTPLRLLPSVSTGPPPKKSGGSAPPASPSPTSTTASPDLGLGEDQFLAPTTGPFAVPLPGTTIPVVTVPAVPAAGVVPVPAVPVAAVDPGAAIRLQQALEELASAEGFQDEVTVVDDAGAVTRQRKVPLDLMLLESLEAGTPFSDAVLGFSRASASLLGLGTSTITEFLGKISGSSNQAVHLRLGLPLLELPGAEVIEEALLTEADVLLLDDEVPLSSRLSLLEESARVFDTGFFRIGGGRVDSPAEDRVEDRVRGNLEILRIQQQEGF